MRARTTMTTEETNGAKEKNEDAQDKRAKKGRRTLSWIAAPIAAATALAALIGVADWTPLLGDSRIVLRRSGGCGYTVEACKESCIKGMELVADRGWNSGAGNPSRAGFV